MKMAFIALASALALSACKSSSEIRAEKQAAANVEDDVKCRSFGFEAGTTGYGECRLRLDEARSADAASRRAAILQYYSAQQQSIQPIQPAPLPRTTFTDCYTSPYGTTQCQTR